jgi:hypothetical protein
MGKSCARNCVILLAFVLLGSAVAVITKLPLNKRVTTYLSDCNSSNIPDDVFGDGAHLTRS